MFPLDITQFKTLLQIYSALILNKRLTNVSAHNSCQMFDQNQWSLPKISQSYPRIYQLYNFRLHNQFFKFFSFSKMTQMFVDSISLDNFFDLLASLAIVCLVRKSISLFIFCMNPVGTKQHLCFFLRWCWIPEKRLIHIVKIC